MQGRPDEYQDMDKREAEEGKDEVGFAILGMARTDGIVGGSI